MSDWVMWRTCDYAGCDAMIEVEEDEKSADMIICEEHDIVQKKRAEFSTNANEVLRKK